MLTKSFNATKGVFILASITLGLAGCAATTVVPIAPAAAAVQLTTTPPPPGSSCRYVGQVVSKNVTGSPQHPLYVDPAEMNVIKNAAAQLGANVVVFSPYGAASSQQTNGLNTHEMVADAYSCATLY